MSEEINNLSEQDLVTHCIRHERRFQEILYRKYADEMYSVALIYRNYRGDKMSVHPKLLVVPTDLEEVAWEMIRSTGKPDTANNNANMYNGMFDLVVWDFLTDTNAWFMVDPRLMKLNLIWFQRIALEVFGDGNLFSGTRNIGGYYRAALGVRDWRWIYGNNPS
jgi:hypothetical protein